MKKLWRRKSDYYEIHPTSSLAEARKELRESRYLISVLRAHVDDGTETCTVCINALKEYDRKWGADRV